MKICPINNEQKEALEDTTPNLLLFGQGGSGKTEVGADKGILIGSLYKNNQIFFIRRKKVDLRLTLWKRFVEKLDKNLIVSKDENQMVYKIKNGTEFYGLGMDNITDVNKLASTECGMAIIEEATEIPFEYYDEKIQRAVRYPKVPFHQTILMCNPASPTHWIYKKWFEEKNAGYKSIFFKTLPPPFLPQSYYDWLNGLTGVFAQRYREGKWIAMEGLVYPFDPRKHIIEPIVIPPDWKRVIAIDFGFDHPFVCGWFVISPSDIWYLYRQIYMTNRIVEKHAEDIKKFCKIDGITDIVAICDHDAEDRATLGNRGINTVPANKDRLSGQQSVYKLISENRFFIFSNSLVETDFTRQMKKLPIKVEQEFGTYGWATKGKEDMVKQKDDGMDMIRYAIHTYLTNGMNELNIRFV